MTFWNAIRLAALFATLLADLSFIVIMHVWVPWRSNPWGRHVMVFSYVLASTLVAGLAFLVFGDYPGRVQILSGLYVAIAAVLWQRVGLAIAAHRRGRRTPKRTDPP